MDKCIEVQGLNIQYSTTHNIAEWAVWLRTRKTLRYSVLYVITASTRPTRNKIRKLRQTLYAAYRGN